VVAGCASHSLYRRKRPSTQADGASTSKTILAGAVQAVREKIGVASLPQHTVPCGVGEWEPVWLGRADYLDKGVERDWSFRDAVYVDGEVIMVSTGVAAIQDGRADGQDNGDRIPHSPADSEPVGLAQGMEKYLRRGMPEKNLRIKESVASSNAQGAGAIPGGKNAEGRDDTHTS